MLQLAQTHVIESLPKKVWKTEKMDQKLELVGSRKALAIVEFGSEPVPASPQLVVRNGPGTSDTIVPLNPPSAFPPTAGDVDPASLDDGAPYSATAYSALLDAPLVAPLPAHLEVYIALSGGGEKLYNLTGDVGCPTHMNVITLPFYLFGATEHTQWGAPKYGHGTTTVTPGESRTRSPLLLRCLPRPRKLTATPLAGSSMR
jgi:hypothetical protein